MNSSFNVNETYLTNHPGNFSNIMPNNNDSRSYSQMVKDTSFVDPYPQSRGIPGSHLNISASDV